jgi:hypothetical protein
MMHNMRDSRRALCQTYNYRLQRTVMDKVPSHEGQRAAAEPGR